MIDIAVAGGATYQTECAADRLVYDPAKDILTSSIGPRDPRTVKPDTTDRCEAATWRRPFPAEKLLTSSFAFRVGRGPRLEQGRTGWVVMHQWKGMTATRDTRGSPLLSLELAGPKLNTLRIVARSTPSGTAIAVYNRLWDAPSPIKRDRWVRYRDEVRFNLKGCTVRVWIDNRLVVDRSDLACGQGDAVSYYTKYGVYRSNMGPALRVDFRGIRDGAS